MATAIKRLGARVRELRLERGLSQEAAAAKAQFDGKHWQAIELAQTNPTIATLVGVARALGVTLAKLLESV